MPRGVPSSKKRDNSNSFRFSAVIDKQTRIDLDKVAALLVVDGIFSETPTQGVVLDWLVKDYLDRKSKQ